MKIRESERAREREKRDKVCRRGGKQRTHFKPTERQSCLESSAIRPWALFSLSLAEIFTLRYKSQSWFKLIMPSFHSPLAISPQSIYIHTVYLYVVISFYLVNTYNNIIS